MATTKAKGKARIKPMTPKAGLTKNRYKCGGKLRKPKK